LTPWSNFEPCTAACGGGTKSRRRYVNMSTTLCPELECMKMGLIETEPCNTQPCRGPCVMGPWSTWSGCSSSCGLGFESRTRGVEDSGDGRCEWDYEERPCNSGDCPVPCTYTEFTEWSPCPVTCIPPGTPSTVSYSQFRAKYRISGGALDCPPVQTDSKTCDPYPVECDQMCVVSDWGNWSACSSPFGWGERRREREVLQRPTGREICPQLYLIDRCYHEPPSNNCTWSTWSEWSPCSASCRTATDIPTQYKERYLLRAPSTVADEATGSVVLSLAACGDLGAKVLTQKCVDIPFCPIDCVMTKWGPWSECQHPGFKTRERRITSLPVYGGAACHPCLKEIDQCTIKTNELPSDECEVGKCLQEIENEIAQAQENAPAATY
jgi:hypothetical protein